MEQERVTLSWKELHRVKVMERLCTGDLNKAKAAGTGPRSPRMSLPCSGKACVLPPRLLQGALAS